ncbi:unnamed protein product [Calypogeia fissa]
MNEGLTKALVPWAGRWVATPGGMGRQLLCNDKGVPFIEAYADEDMDSVVNFCRIPTDPRAARTALITIAPGKIKVYEVSASVIKSLSSVNALLHAHIWKTVSSLPFSITGGRDIAMGTRFYDPREPNLLGNVYTMMVSPQLSTDLVNMRLYLIASKIQEKLKATDEGNMAFSSAQSSISR